MSTLHRQRAGGARMKKGTFATHAAAPHHDGVAVCRTIKKSGPLLFSPDPTCRRCRFFAMEARIGRDRAIEVLAAELT